MGGCGRGGPAPRLPPNSPRGIKSCPRGRGGRRSRGEGKGQKLGNPRPFRATLQAPFLPLAPHLPPRSKPGEVESLGARPSASSIAQWDKVLPPPLSPPQQHHHQQLAQQLVYQQRRQVRGVRRHHSSSDAMAGQKRPTQLSVPGGHQSLPPGVPVPWIMLGGIRKSRR